MKNRDIYQRDPGKITLLNNGVAAMTDALSDDERRTLRFELEHFVCEGEYQRGLVRILESYVSNQGQPEQPAAWVSGFFGSGKSHLAKMLRFLWTDYIFPRDDASARGLARLPTDVQDVLKEITTLGKRAAGLHAAAGTLGAGAGDSVRLALLGIVFKSADLPESHPQARFCIWLKKNGNYEQVRAVVEAEERSFPARAERHVCEPADCEGPAGSRSRLRRQREKMHGPALRAQFPKPRDITTDEFVTALEDALAPDGEMPCTVIILDEVQQYIGDDTGRSYVVQGGGGSLQQAIRRSPPVPGDRSDGAVRHASAAAAARPIHRERRALRHRCRDRDPAGGAGETPGPCQRRQVDARRERRRAGSASGRNQDRTAQRGQVRSGGRLPLAAGPPPLLGARPAGGRPRRHGRPAPHPIAHRLTTPSDARPTIRSARSSLPISCSRRFRPPAAVRRSAA